MRVSSTGQSEYHDGHEVGRYGRDLSANKTYLVIYHDGLHSYDEPAWGLDEEIEWKASISADTFLVAEERGVFAIDRKAMREAGLTDFDGKQQYVPKLSDPFVRKVTDDNNDVLRGELWIDCNNAHGSYHKMKNES